MQASLQRFSSFALRAVAGAAVALAGSSAFAGTTTTAAVTDCLASTAKLGSINMRVLVLAPAGSEPSTLAITQAMDYLGTPYTVLPLVGHALTSADLCSVTSAGVGTAKYSGVVLSSGNLVYAAAGGTYPSALTADGWTKLWAFESKYRVRELALDTAAGYQIPGATTETYGFAAATSTVGTADSNGTTATLTAQGKALFPYLHTAGVYPISNHAWTYYVPTTTAVPLLNTARGYPVLVTNTTTDGREQMILTAASATTELHTTLLAYGMLNWLQKGLFIGQRAVHLSIQPDDIENDDSMWDPVGKTTPDANTLRLVAKDWTKYKAWQAALNTKYGSSIVTEMPFNGYGATTAFDGSYAPATKDDFTPAVRASNSWANWISHTYDHTNLDALNYADMLAELTKNNTNAIKYMGLNLNDNYFTDSLVTPDISGLNNSEALRAIKDFGVKYLVSDTSKFCGHRDQAHADALGCPAPNVGIYNDLMPSILMIPRYPTNLFYNVNTPALWQDEYQFVYVGTTPYGSYTEADILADQANLLFDKMVRYDMRPFMFHAPNMQAYDGTHSLLGDLVDAAMARYWSYFNLPVTSLRQGDIGAAMASRMVLRSALTAPSPLTVTITPTSSSLVTLKIVNPTKAPVVVPLIGVKINLLISGASADYTRYGDITTSTVNMGAGKTASADRITMPW